VFPIAFHRSKSPKKEIESDIFIDDNELTKLQQKLQVPKTGGIITFFQLYGYQKQLHKAQETHHFR